MLFCCRNSKSTNVIVPIKIKSITYITPPNTEPPPIPPRKSISSVDSESKEKSNITPNPLIK
jgi:hypothetical protein